MLHLSKAFWGPLRKGLPAGRLARPGLFSLRLLLLRRNSRLRMARGLLRSSACCLAVEAGVRLASLSVPRMPGDSGGSSPECLIL